VSTSAIELREGDARDLDQVDRLMAAAFDPRWGEAWTRNQVIGMLSLPGVWLTLAERGGLGVGFALTRSTLDEAELLLLAVAPNARRLGIGSALLRTVVADCGVRGVSKLHLEMREGNDAIRLYTKNGFGKVGERRDYYRGGDGKTYSAFTLQRSVQ
jgi:[ribosomal protein S18]-alanine N-acetyltransferase